MIEKLTNSHHNQNYGVIINTDRALSMLLVYVLEAHVPGVVEGGRVVGVACAVRAALAPITAPVLRAQDDLIACNHT